MTRFSKIEVKHIAKGNNTLSIDEYSDHNTLSLWLFPPHDSLGLEYHKRAGPEGHARNYEAQLPFASPALMFEFVNRFLRLLPPQNCEFSEFPLTPHEEQIRPFDTLDIFQLPFSANYSCQGPGEMVARLKATRLLSRQPDQMKLVFGNGCQIEPEPEDGSPGYGRVLEEVLHIPRVNFSLLYWRTDAWEEAIDTLLVLLDAALVKHRPIGEAARLLHISIEFPSFDLPDLLAKFKLPDRLFAYLQRPDIPSRGVVQILSCDDTTVPGIRFVQFLVTVAQNYAGGTAQMFAERPSQQHNDDEEYVLEWPTGGN
ncbi:unnamed protein product, partial [Mesorhabditis spiculigera]